MKLIIILAGIYIIVAIFFWAFIILTAEDVDKMDNKKKKKLDRKRIALAQKHERAYLKKICKEQLKKLELMKYFSLKPCSKAKLKRIIRALQKYLDRDKR